MFTQLECDRQKRLALEYDGSSGAVLIVESSYGEAHSFSSEANWYIGTIALDHCFSIHFSFFTINGVSAFINSHNDGLFVVLDGYGAVVVIVGDGSIERFSECTDRNHGSPVAVNVWSSVHGEELLVNDILGRTDGHYNVVMSENAAITSGVVKSSCIEALVGIIFYSDTDGNFCWFRSVDGQNALTIVNIFLNINSYNCIVVALIFNVSIELTINLSFVAVSLYNGNVNIVFRVHSTFGWIEFEIEAVVRINNGQSLLNVDVFNYIKCVNNDFSTDQCFVRNFVSSGPECTIEEIGINDSFAIETISYVTSRSLNLDTVFIDILSGSSYELAKGYFIIKDEVSVGAHIMGNELYIKIYNIAKVCNIESSFCIVAAKKSYTYNILARSEIVFMIVTYISEGPLVADWNKMQIGRIKSGVVAAAYNTKVLSMFSLSSSFNCYIPSSRFCRKIVITSEDIASFIKDGEFHSIGEICTVVVYPVAVIASEDITAIFGGINIICTSNFFYNTNGVLLVTNSDGNRNISVVIHGESDSELTHTTGGNGGSSVTIVELQVLAIARGEGNFLIFSWVAVFLTSITSPSVFGSTVSYKTIITNEVYIINFFLVVKGDAVIAFNIFTFENDVINNDCWSNNSNFCSFQWCKVINKCFIYRGSSYNIADTSINVVNTTTFEGCFKRSSTTYISSYIIEMWVVRILGQSSRGLESYSISEVTFLIGSPNFNVLQKLAVGCNCTNSSKVKAHFTGGFCLYFYFCFLINYNLTSRSGSSCSGEVWSCNRDFLNIIKGIRISIASLIFI